MQRRAHLDLHADRLGETNAEALGLDGGESVELYDQLVDADREAEEAELTVRAAHLHPRALKPGAGERQGGSRQRRAVLDYAALHPAGRLGE